MIFLLSNMLLMGLRWMLQRIRYERYANALHEQLNGNGLFIEKASVKGQSSISSMKLLKSSITFRGLGETLLEDGHLRMHRMNSMVNIDLTNWFAYKEQPKFDGEVRVLLEARRSAGKEIEKREAFTLESLHILSCGTTLAWRVEKPLGIVLACDLSDLVKLIDAFGQEKLVIDTGFEVTGLATVKTVSWPHHLISTEEDVRSLSPGIQESFMNEKTGFSTSPKQSDKLNETSLAAAKGDNGDTPSTLTKTNSVNKLSTSCKNQDSPDRGKPTGDFTPEPHETESVSSKPPNILIYCGVKDSARKFTEAKNSLQSCVNTDAYTIYQLTHDSLISSPWQRLTAALVITSCDHLRSDAEEKIYNFVKNSKGNLISFNSSIDKRFSLRLKKNDGKSEKPITFSFKDWKSVSSVSGHGVYTDISEQLQVLIPMALSPSEGLTENELQSKDGNDSGSIVKPNGASRGSSQEALVVTAAVDGGGTAILSQLLLERDPACFAIDDESFTVLKKSNTDRLAVLRDLLSMLGIDTNPGPVPKLTCCHLVSKRSGLREKFLDSFKHRLNNDNVLKSRVMSLKFYAAHDEVDIQPNVLPVTTKSAFDLETEYFDLQAYWQNLKTTSLGQLVFYTDVITSTMTVFEGLLFSIPNRMGPVAIAGRQTSGRGRGGNAWLSPVGCAMFTLPMKFSLDSELGSHISFLQHLVAVALIQSVVTLPGYETINIRLKWPNDIYFGREIKLGGVLVTSTLLDDVLYATIGCGFNVSNSNPTMCINDIIHQHNSSNPNLPLLEPLSGGQLLGRTLTILENLVEDFEKKGWNNFCQLYYKYWLHGGTRVKIELDTKTVGEIVGLDKNGFLSLRTEDGSLISVRPDGNSFDMMHNLIHFKTQ